MKNRPAWAWTFVVLYAGVIFAGSCIPGSSPLLRSVEKYVWDKLLHLLEYSFLGILLVRALFLSFKIRSAGYLSFIALVIGGLYSITDEWHQSFVPMRDSSAGDCLADSIGVFIGAFLWSFLILKNIKKESNV